MVVLAVVFVVLMVDAFVIFTVVVVVVNFLKFHKDWPLSTKYPKKKTFQNDLAMKQHLTHIGIIFILSKTDKHLLKTKTDKHFSLNRKQIGFIF